MSAPVVELRAVSKRFGAGETAVDALVTADLAVHAGEVLIIQGPSGSGKTTLLSILGLLLRPTSGQVLVRGQDVTALTERELPGLRARTFGFVFQGFNLFPALTALENVVLPRRLKNGGGGGGEAGEAEEEGRRLLAAVGLGGRLGALPEQLSGGQKQRVAIARALAGRPPLILGDEPTAALDARTALGVMELLAGLAREQGHGVVVVTHDHRLDRFADRVIRVDDGQVFEEPPGANPARPQEGQLRP